MNIRPWCVHIYIYINGYVAVEKAKQKKKPKIPPPKKIIINQKKKKNLFRPLYCVPHSKV